MDFAILIMIAAVFLAVILILLLLARNDSKPQDRDWPKTHRPEFKPPEIIPPERRAGIRGEEAAEELIRSSLRPEDALFTNVDIEYEGKIVRGKMILPPPGKEFFTRHGKQIFTSRNKEFFT